MSENPGGDTSESGFVRDLPKRWLLRPLHWLAAIVIVAILYYAVLVVPAGTIGIYDLFGRVSDQVVAPGIHIVNPLAKIHNRSVRTLYLFPLLLFLVFKFSFRQRMPPGR